MGEQDDDKKDSGRKRHSEPAMPLPPPEANTRVTLEFMEIPLAIPDDGSSDDHLPTLGLPDEFEGEDSEPDALGLVGSRPSVPALDLRSEMHERFALDDFTAALGIAELLIGRNAADEDAIGIAAECRRRLVQLYTSRIGSLDRIPVLDVPAGEIRWLGLDHRGGFLLSRIDGTHTIDELCDVAGMGRLEVLKTLAELRDAGAIRIE